MGEIEQSINLGYRQVFWPVGNLDDRIPPTYLAFLKHTKVKSGSLVSDEERSHTWLIHPDADAVASNTGLCHLKERAPDAILIADTNLIVR